MLTATTVVLHYFKNTFSYESLGHSHHVAWVGFSFSCLSVLLGIVKVYTSSVSEENSEYQKPKYKYQNGNNTPYNSQMRPVSPKSVHSQQQLMNVPYQRDSYYGSPPNPPANMPDMRYSESATYDSRPMPPKNYIPS